ncbi:MAG: hypothetical protein AB1401_03540 [Thermodesulfobacteriota bacterium]
MKIPRKIIQKLIKWLLKHWIELTVSAIVAYLGGIFHLYQLSYDFLKISFQLPSPLWVILALVLVVLIYTYIKTEKLNQSSKKSPVKIEIIPIGKELKWKVCIRNPYDYSVDKIPFCQEHDLLLLNYNLEYFCPEYIKGNCKIRFDDKRHLEFYETAISYIDKILRNTKLC